MLLPLMVVLAAEQGKRASPLVVPALDRGDLATRATAELQLVQTFETADELGSWRAYFENVYGGIDEMRFPFSLASLNTFIAEWLPVEVRESLKIVKDDVPISVAIVLGDLRRSGAYIIRCELDVCTDGTDGTDSTGGTHNNITSDCVAAGFVGPACAQAVPSYFPPRGTESAAILMQLRQQAYPREGYANDTFIEVLHTTRDVPRTGFWFYAATGTGVYINLGYAAVRSSA